MEAECEVVYQAHSKSCFILGVVELLLTMPVTEKTGICRQTEVPVDCVAPAVGLIDSWGTMQEFIIAIAVTIAFSTIAVIAGAGHMTQLIINLKEKKKKDERNS